MEILANNTIRKLLIGKEVYYLNYNHEQIKILENNNNCGEIDFGTNLGQISLFLKKEENFFHFFCDKSKFF